MPSSCCAARLGFHRRPAGVGLHAALAPAGALGAAALDDHVADLAGGAAAEPGLAVEDQAAADAGAPEDADQGLELACPAPRWNSASVATWTSLPTLTSVPSCLCERLGEREAALPAGQVAGAGDDAGLLVGVAGGADPDARSGPPVSTPAASAASRSAAAIAAATSSGPPLVGVGLRAPRRRTLPRGVDDGRLDLRPAEVDAAAQVRHAPVAAFVLASASCVDGPIAVWKAAADGRFAAGGSGGRSGAGTSATGGLRRRWRIDRHAARGGFFIRYPVEGEVLEALDEGRLRIGEGTLLEPGCWLTLAPEARDRDRRGLLPQPQHDARRPGADRDRRPHDVRQRLLRRRRRRTASTTPTSRSPGRASPRRARCEIGANCWFGVNCVVTSGVTIGERCVIGANSVVTEDLPAGTIAAGAPAKVIREIEFREG